MVTDTKESLYLLMVKHGFSKKLSLMFDTMLALLDLFCDIANHKPQVIPAVGFQVWNIYYTAML